MALVVLAFILVSGVMLGYIESSNSLKTTKDITRGSYDNVGKRLTQKDKYSESYDLSSLENDEDMKALDMETVEQTLLRTCRTIHTLSLLNKCSAPYRETEIWGFVGSPGTIGSLSVGANSAWGGNTQLTFDCTLSGQAKYGRGLLQASIPKSEIDKYGYSYDFQTMATDYYTDPCGYTGIIR